MNVWNAAKTHQLNVVKECIAKDKNIIHKCDNYGNTPLYYACFSGDVSIAKYLLTQGALYDDRMVLNSLNQAIRDELKQFPNSLQITEKQVTLSQEEELKKYLRKHHTPPRKNDSWDEFICNLYATHVIQTSTLEIKDFSDKYFCDVFFYFPTDQQVFGCHLFVLFTYWNYFRSNFFSTFETQMNSSRIITMPSTLECKLFSSILKYIYTGEFHLMPLIVHQKESLAEIIQQITSLGLEKELAKEIQYCIKECNSKVSFSFKFFSTPIRYEITNLLQMDKYFEYCSDLKLSFGNEKIISCHKILICTLNNYFSTMHQSQYEEAKLLLDSNSIFQLCTESIPSYSSLLHYLHVLYGNPFVTENMNLLEAYFVGSFFNDSQYKCQTITEINNNLNLENVYSILQFATHQMQNENDLQLLCINFLQQMAKQNDFQLYQTIIANLLHLNEWNSAKKVETEIFRYIFVSKFAYRLNYVIFDESLLVNTAQKEMTCPFCNNLIDCWVQSLEPHYFVECSYFIKYRIALMKQLASSVTMTKTTAQNYGLTNFLPFPTHSLQNNWQCTSDTTNVEWYTSKSTIQEKIQYFFIYKGLLPRSMRQFEMVYYRQFFNELYSNTWNSILKIWKREIESRVIPSSTSATTTEMDALILEFNNLITENKSYKN